MVLDCGGVDLGLGLEFFDWDRLVFCVDVLEEGELEEEGFFLGEGLLHC